MQPQLWDWLEFWAKVVGYPFVMIAVPAFVLNNLSLFVPYGAFTTWVFLFLGTLWWVGTAYLLVRDGLRALHRVQRR